MRLSTALCCIVILAANVVAQTSSSSPSGTGQQSSGQQQGSDQPQNPLQEQPTKPAEETRKAESSSFNVGEAGGAGKDQALGELRLMTRYTQINGDPTRSFLVEGENNLAEFNYFLDHRFLATRRLQVLSMFRATDDSSIDPEHSSMQRGYLRLYGPRDEYIAGDALVSFSRLSLNQNIRGLYASWKLGDSWKVSTVGGVFIDRWGSLWKDIEGRPYLSSVAGGRLERRFKRNSSLGFNFSFSKDNTGTLPPAELGTPPQPALNEVGSIDLKLQFPFGLRVDSEYAYSFTDFDIRQGTPPCETITPPPPVPCDTRMPQLGLGTQSDWGGRVEAAYRYHKLSLRAMFVRYQPNFASLNARQVPDLQDVLFRASYDLTSWLTVDGTIRRSNNNLRQQLTAVPDGFETILWGPEAKLILHDLSFYRRMVLEVGYRHRDVQGVGVLLSPDSTQCNLQSDGSTRCADRVVRMPFAELTLPYRTTFFSVGYERMSAVDFIDPTQTSNTDRVYTSLRGIYDLGGWHINPMLRYEFQRQTHNLNNNHDNNRLGTAALFVEAPRWFILELNFRDTTATIFGPMGYSRPSYRAALTYKIANDENMLLIFSFLRTNNFYLSPPDLVPTPNFDERQMGVTLVYKFGKRR